MRRPGLRAPRFWTRRPGVAALMLGPVASRYGAHVAARMERPGTRAGVPVVCVGNFSLGGAGKTPLAIALAALLRDAGERPVFLSRGYGGRERGPHLVHPGDSATQVGDEPLLLSGFAPTIVAADRVAGAAMAVGAGATVIVMDDGFQNPSLMKDASVIAVDGEVGAGNGRAFPAGPLRAPLYAQMPHASAVVVIGGGQGGREVADFARGSGRAVFHGRLVPDASAAWLRGRRVLAFAGIARPQKFLRTLADLGAIVVAVEAFGDHHAYREGDALRLASRAREVDLLPVTTAKDRVRLAGGPAREALAAITTVVPVRLEIAERAAMLDLLGKALGRSLT